MAQSPLMLILESVYRPFTVTWLAMVCAQVLTASAPTTIGSLGGIITTSGTITASRLSTAPAENAVISRSLTALMACSSAAVSAGGLLGPQLTVTRTSNQGTKRRRRCAVIHTSEVCA